MKRFTRWPPRLEMRGTSSHTDLVQQCWKSSNQRVRFKGKTGQGANLPYSVDTGAIFDRLGGFCGHLFDSIVCEDVNDGEEVNFMVVGLTQTLKNLLEHNFQIRINTWLGIAYISLSGSINPSTTEFFFARWRLPAPGLSEEDEIVMTGLIEFWN